MKNPLSFLLAVATVILCSSATPNSDPAIDYCRVYGVIYIEKDRAFADVRVYIEESEGLARMQVFREDNALYADRPGIWYITDDRNAADYRVYIEKNRSFAQFSIFYINNPSFAGCR